MMTPWMSSAERSVVLVGILAVLALSRGCDSAKTGGSANTGGTAAQGGFAGATGGAAAVAAGGSTSQGAGGITGSDAGDGNAPLDEFVAGFATAQCAMFVRCGLASDQSYCVTMQFPLGKMDRLAAEVASVRAGKATYDGKKARTCLNAVAGFACDEFWAGSPGAIRAACQGTLSGGTVADGDACHSKVECHQGSYCRLKADTCTGTCAVIAPSGSGCQDDADCPSGQVCDAFLWPAEGTCVDPTPPGATAGSRCGTYKACAPGFYCSFGNGCQPQGKEGDLCDGWIGSCGGLVCVATLVSPQTCRKYAAKGEPCQAPEQCGAVLYSTIKCDMSTNVCVDKPGDGSCFNTSTSYLAANGCDPFTSYCDASTATCAPYKSIGASCAQLAECGPSATCVSDPDTGTRSCVAKCIP
jgi:hypothetical protein